MTGRRRALRGHRLGIAVAVAVTAAVATVAAVAFAASAALSGHSGKAAAEPAAARSVRPGQAYVAAVPSAPVQAPPGGLTAGKGKRHAAMAPATPSILPAGVPANVPDGSAPPKLTVMVASTPSYGEVLTSVSGQTLYRLTGGAGTADTRYLPVLVHPGEALRLPVLLPGRLGTLRRPDGTSQLTYDGWPLYLFSGDHAAGDTNGVGPLWSVIKALP